MFRKRVFWKRVFSEKSFSREIRNSRESREPPDCGKQRRIRPFVEILEILPVEKTPFVMTPFSGLFWSRLKGFQGGSTGISGNQLKGFEKGSAPLQGANLKDYLFSGTESAPHTRNSLEGTQGTKPPIQGPKCQSGGPPRTHSNIGCAKSWAFFSQKFLRVRFLRSVKLGKWVAGTSTPGLHRR